MPPALSLQSPAALDFTRWHSSSPFPAPQHRSFTSPPCFPGLPGAEARAVRIVDGSVEFRDRPDYLIPVSRLRTPLQVLGCVSHLMTKPWMTPETARAFIDVVCQHHGIRIVETA